MSSGKFPSKNLFGTKPEAPAPKSDNALWRTSDWFPTMDKGLAEALKSYHAEMLKFNLKLNLISRNTEREADEGHFADCVLAAEVILKRPLPKQVYDIGSGNGLPGLILALCRKDIEFLLVESDARKCEFIKHTIGMLKLSNCKVVNARLESLGESTIECAVSRGFASLSKALLTVNKTFKIGGAFYHLKGNNWSREIAEIPTQLVSIWSPELVGEYSLPVSQARRAVVCTKKMK